MGWPLEDRPVLIFVSGWISGAGKSTASLGLLGSLLDLGYKPSELAYIKPATQCVIDQLVWNFCERHGIAHQGVGPIRYLPGFTQHFLNGKTYTSRELLARARAAVEEIGKGKKVVVVDGVGYPAVGSICGTSNAEVAYALGAPVLLVGPAGVGDSLDSFNMMRTFFEAHRVRVLGSVLNKGNAKNMKGMTSGELQAFLNGAIGRYAPSCCVFGVVPEMSLQDLDLEQRTETVVRNFAEHVDVAQIVNLAGDGTAKELGPVACCALAVAAVVMARRLCTGRDSGVQAGLLGVGVALAGATLASHISRARLDRAFTLKVTRTPEVDTPDSAVEAMQEKARTRKTGG
mmetsp:Transcript_79831/g.182902  ORF Transcript_79831/g.182902 Transcript_79831/m.182902 type:complete len:345 (+) Transcript_79831:13-1047(+)